MNKEENFNKNSACIQGEIDRLEKLLDAKQYQGFSIQIGVNYIQNKELARHLVSQDVIVPPCRIGDKVWVINPYGVRDLFQATVVGIVCELYSSSKVLIFKLFTDSYSCKGEVYGRTAFLTECAARAVLDKIYES